MTILNFKPLFKRISRTHLVLVLLIVIGSSLRFYDLNWGAPFYFHPDERNIASAISRLHLPDQLNPQFFAYGSLPIYLAYFIGVLTNLSSITDSTVDIWTVSFEQAIIIGRAMSSILSVGIIALLYFTSLHFVSRKISLLAAFMATMSVGFIQYAHFGTFETYLTFFSLLLFYCLLKYIHTLKYSFFIISCIILSILISIKISSLALAPLPLLAMIIVIKRRKALQSRKNILSTVFSLGVNTGVLTIISLCIFLITNPFTLLDWSSFRGSMQYESAVALGTLSVFYTGSFTNTIPGIYQALHVMPYLLNPLTAILIVPIFLMLLLQLFKKKQPKLLLLLIFFLFLLVPQLVFYVKWTRYFVPTLPFVYLMITISLSIFHAQKKSRHIYNFVVIAVISTSILWAFAFMKTVYFSQDTRLEAMEFAKSKFTNDTKILSEVYDMGIVPFNKEFSAITLFNFYDLEHDPSLAAELEAELNAHDVLILPSQRIIKSRIEHPDVFPLGNSFYSSVLNNKRYTQLYKTPCDLFCKLLYLGDPIYGVEDTTNVFDRPTLYIYRINHEI